MNISELLENNTNAQIHLNEVAEGHQHNLETNSKITGSDRWDFENSQSNNSLSNSMAQNTNINETNNSQILTSDNSENQNLVNNYGFSESVSTTENPSNTSASIEDDSNEENIDYNKMIMFFSSNDSSEFSNENNPSDGNNIDEELAYESMGPLEKFCKLCENASPSNLETAAKYVVPAMEFCQNQEDFMRVFFFLRKYCFFTDVVLRSLWLEQIQNVIHYLYQESENIKNNFQFTEDFNMATRLAMLINDLMREQAYQVKKCATTSLLFIVEKQLLNPSQIEKIVVPSLLNLVKENDEDFDIDCVSLFSKIAPILGSELTAAYFIQPFCHLSTSSVFHTRKACASNIADLANVVSVEEVEKYLLPHFTEFMKDQVWAIRKVCADLFSSFALRCSRKTRETILTEHFIKLLDDNSRWVKISAYKSLGPFISTFIKHNNEKESEVIDVAEETAPNMASNKEYQESKILPVADAFNTNTAETTENKENEEKITTDKNVETKDNEYTNFVYWKIRLPNLDDSLNEEKSDSSTSNSSNNASLTNSNSNNSSLQAPLSTPTSSLASVAQQETTLTGLLNSTNLLEKIINSKSNETTFYSPISSFYNSNQNSHQPIQKTIEQLTTELKQEIVPPLLLSYYITMVDINSLNSLDSEMNYNCAFNFPAIALTLGVSHWKYIRDLYKKLAEDVGWKVRQTLAYSIHELAIILGTEITQIDLVPIFDSYIKDVDEVRMGIVSNLTKFLKVLSLDFKRSYMPKLNDFLKMDNQRNWRFRNELGLQICYFTEQFPCDCLANFVQPVAFTLALDKVAEVRITAIRALVEIFKQFQINNEETFRHNFIDDSIRTFANSNRWSFRQLYVVLCEQILIKKAYNSFETFNNDFLPKLLNFRNDKVANIRVLLARVVTNYLINNDYFKDNKSLISNELELTVQYLLNDLDSDVKSYFAHIRPEYSNNDDSSRMQDESTEFELRDNETNINLTSENSKDHILMMETSPPPPPSLPPINTSGNVAAYLHHPSMVHVNEEEEQASSPNSVDNEDDEDEIIDKTKINQLTIVNKDEQQQANELDDEDMDEVIEVNQVKQVSGLVNGGSDDESAKIANSKKIVSQSSSIPSNNLEINNEDELY